MSKITLTKIARIKYGKNGKILPPLPLNTTSKCLLCKQPMRVADGSLAYYHGCCRKVRRDAVGLQNHIAKEHATS